MHKQKELETLKTNNTQSPLIDAIKQKDVNLVAYLLKNGADVNQTEKDNNSTPIFNAVQIFDVVQKEDLAIVQLLIDYGADVNRITIYGFTPLILAIDSRNVELLELLLKAGAKIDTVSYRGETALFKAVRSNNLEMTKLFINHGANINLLNDKGYTPLDIANKRASHDIIKLLIKNGAQVSPRIEEYRKNRTELEKIFAKENISVVNSTKIFNSSISDLLISVKNNGSKPYLNGLVIFGDGEFYSDDLLHNFPLYPVSSILTNYIVYSNILLRDISFAVNSSKDKLYPGKCYKFIGTKTFYQANRPRELIVLKEVKLSNQYSQSQIKSILKEIHKEIEEYDY